MEFKTKEEEIAWKIAHPVNVEANAPCVVAHGGAFAADGAKKKENEKK
jgi:hypothetical protein